MEVYPYALALDPTTATYPVSIKFVDTESYNTMVEMLSKFNEVNDHSQTHFEDNQKVLFDNANVLYAFTDYIGYTFHKKLHLFSMGVERYKDEFRFLFKGDIYNYC